jgi:hypothetical protein
MGARSKLTGERHIQPAALAHQGDKLILDLEKLRQHNRNHVQGGMVKDPTTGSTQASGVGNTDWNVDIDAMVVVVGGVAKHFEDQADYDVHSGSLLTGLSNGNSVIAALVAKNVSGTVSLAVVKGTAATTGSQVAPTDAEIQAGVGAGNDWVKLAEITINRTGDTTVTQSQDNTKRPILGVNVDTDFGDWSSFT